MRSSTRTGVASCSNRIRQASKIATAADRFCEVSRRIFPFIQRVFADSGYASEKVAKATLIAVEIVRKNPDQVRFAVNLRRWVPAISSARAVDFVASLVRFRYSLSGCSPPCTDQTGTPSLRGLLLPGFQRIGLPPRCWI